jgi:hypothetical protein
VLIIWGIRSVRRKLAVVLAMCHRCNTPCAQSIFVIRRWFTLFFIPLIPMGTKYVGSCSMCGVATVMTEEVARQLEHDAEQQRHRPPEMTPDGPISPIGAPQRTTAILPASALAPPPQLDQPAFCGACGTPADRTDAFCQECGTARSAVTPGSV